LRNIVEHVGKEFGALFFVSGTLRRPSNEEFGPRAAGLTESEVAVGVRGKISGSGQVIQRHALIFAKEQSSRIRWRNSCRRDVAVSSVRRLRSRTGIARLVAAEIYSVKTTSIPIRRVVS